MYTALCDPCVTPLNLSETIKLGALVRDPPGLKPMIPQRVVCVKSLQLCPTLCDPRDCSLPDSSVHGVLQARTLEWVAILPFPAPGDLSDPGIEPKSLRSPALAGKFFTTSTTGEAHDPSMLKPNYPS